MRNLTIILGCGRLGSSIANYSSQMGENVVVVDPNKASFEKLNDAFSGITIASDTTDIDELRDAGLDSAREAVITTGDDNVNLFLAYVCCKIFEIPYIYVRFDDPDKGLLIQGLPIKAIYPFQLSLDRFSLLRAGVEK